jgi:hypothetical protein|tara:strand:+ start:3306 stop:3998 length:693 start_codon:yes stop_codon:yes gene_type:complete
MGTSGTTAFNLDVADVIEEAFSMIGGEQALGFEPIEARRTLNLLLIDWMNRGILLWKQNIATLDITAGTESYTLPTSLIDITEIVHRTVDGTTTTDLALTRISMEEYIRLTSKSQQSRPTQYAINRLRDAAQLYLWPTPNATTTSGTPILQYFSFNKVEDINKSNEDVDIPFRFLPCLATGLAYKMSIKREGITADRAVMLKQMYEEELTSAMYADKERASLLIKPSFRL